MISNGIFISSSHYLQTVVDRKPQKTLIKCLRLINTNLKGIIISDVTSFNKCIFLCSVKTKPAIKELYNWNAYISTPLDCFGDNLLKISLVSEPPCRARNLLIKFCCHSLILFLRVTRSVVEFHFQYEI